MYGRRSRIEPRGECTRTDAAGETWRQNQASNYFKFTGEMAGTYRTLRPAPLDRAREEGGWPPPNCNPAGSNLSKVAVLKPCPLGEDRGVCPRKAPVEAPKAGPGMAGQWGRRDGEVTG